MKSTIGQYGCWLIVICIFFAFLWVDGVSHEAYWTGWAAIEYALVAVLILAASGFGRAVYDRLCENGVFSAIGAFLFGLVLLAFGFFFVSVCLKPGFPLYLLHTRRGRGAFIAILCATIYGFFSQRRDLRVRDAKINSTATPNRAMERTAGSLDS